MGGRAGKGARGGAGKSVDYLAQAGLSDKDIMKALKKANRRAGLDAAYNARKEAKAKEVDEAYNTILEMLTNGTFAPIPKR